MIYKELSRWIAQSESWQAFIDYKVTAEAQAQYDFITRQDDFYISLLSKLQDTLESFNEGESGENKNDLLSIAKGLEIYSLTNKRESFQGVNYSRNMLYVASLYYLSDFPATSLLLLRPFNGDHFKTDIERFIYYFLSKNYKRKDAQENIFFSRVYNFLREGDFQEIENLRVTFQTTLNPENEVEDHLFVLTYIATAVLNKFSTNNLWYDLTANEGTQDWKPFVRFNMNKTPQIWSFFPSQQAAIKAGILTFSRSFSLQTPTSSGKTSIAELVIFNELKKNPNGKILYLAPFRALASELKHNLGRSLSSKLGIRVKTIYGGNIVTDSDRLRIEQSNVLISTPEKFMAIELGLTGVLDQFETVICDEGHLIDNRSRGISYELLLSRLKRTQTVNRRFIFLSAIIPNIEVINSWLGGTKNDIARSSYRPTEIELALLKKQSDYQFDLEVNPQEEFPGKYILNKFLSKVDFESDSTTYNPTSFKSLAVAAGLKALNSGAVAIFSPTKDARQGISGLAAETIKQLRFNLPKPINFCDQVVVEDLAEYFKHVFGPDFLLVRCIENGFLFHHGDLPQFIREQIEKYVRSESVKFLICTTTLAEGVNLPIKTLVISNARRFNGEKLESLPKRDLKNLIGRAGRAGKETKGTIIIVNPNDYDIFLDVFANRNLEEVKGFLFTVVRAIERYITRLGTGLTNELLDQLEESDYIDNSIIQLLAEDISVEQLDSAVNNLIENTLTFYQSDDALKLRLRELFNLRSEKVKPTIENGQIETIRYTGIPLRAFESVVEITDFNQEFLATEENPLSSVWLEYLFDILFKLKTFTDALPPEYTREKVLNALLVWMNGGWYHDIAQSLNSSIEDALVFIKFIEFNFQNSASSVIKYIEVNRSKNELQTSRAINKWPNFALYGVKSSLEMDLVDVGLPDRIIVLEIAQWFANTGSNYNDQEELEDILFANREELMLFLQERLPKISLLAFTSFLDRNSGE